MTIIDCCVSLKMIKKVLVVLGVVDMRQLLLKTLVSVFSRYITIINLIFVKPLSLSYYYPLCVNYLFYGIQCNFIIFLRIQVEIKTILNKHNELRAKVANGQQIGQPPAANMKKLKWSSELATIAQRWADQCPGYHDPNR